jgi:hypothetical protein
MNKTQDMNNFEKAPAAKNDSTWLLYYEQVKKGLTIVVMVIFPVIATTQVIYLETVVDIYINPFIILRFQTLLGVRKYMDQPKTTLTFYEEIGPEDTPWLTICPIPGFNLIKMNSLVSALKFDTVAEQMRIRNFKTMLFDAPLGEIMSGTNIRSLSLMSNVSVNNLLAETILPLRDYSAHKFNCEMIVDSALSASCGIAKTNIGKLLKSFFLVCRKHQIRFWVNI